jgi:zinc protease
MKKVKNQIEAEYIMGSDSNFFRAMQIGTAETVGAGYQYVLDYVDNIRKVTPDDVRRIARKYLKGEARSVGILLPLKSLTPTVDSESGS